MKNKNTIIKCVMITILSLHIHSFIHARELYKNSAFTLESNKITEGKFYGITSSPNEIISNYTNYLNTSIKIKFSVNGINHAFPYTSDRIYYHSGWEYAISPVFTLDQISSNTYICNGGGKNTSGKIKITVRLDLNPLLKSFNEHGFFIFKSMYRLNKDDFKGVCIAGEVPPLIKNTAEAFTKDEFRLKDDDNDGIYDVTLEFDTTPFNVKENKWNLSKDISQFPFLKTDHNILNASYNLSLEEMLLNVRPDNTYRAGEHWDGVWTRDIGYSIFLSLAILQPDVCKTSLMKKVKDGIIIQDTGTGGSWPVSSDRVIWGIAAWEIFKVTGDLEWLKSAFAIMKNTALKDIYTLKGNNGLYCGETSFMDWREQSYPFWMEPKDIYESKSLSTNVLHYQNFIILCKMAKILNEPSDTYLQEANNLKLAINKNLWSDNLQTYSAYLYGYYYNSQSHINDALGQSLAILFNVADKNKINQIDNNVRIGKYGIPCFYPALKDVPIYHNNAVWPFVQAHWTLAAKKSNNFRAVDHGLAVMLRQSILFLTNKENYQFDNSQLLTSVNSNRQLWSVAGNLAMIYKIIFGMTFDTDSIILTPYIPHSYSGTKELNNFKYRNSIWDIKVHGVGNKISKVLINGKISKNAVLSSKLNGKNTIEIYLDWQNNKIIRESIMPLIPKAPSIYILSDSIYWDKNKDIKYYLIYRNGKYFDKTTTNHYRIKDKNKYVEYQIKAVDNNKNISFLSNPIQIIPNNNLMVCEFEKFHQSFEDSVVGFKGNGYVVTDVNKNELINVSVEIKKSSNYLIRIRYANGAGYLNSSNKCAIRSLLHNNQDIGAIIMPQRGNSWLNWGYSNLIKIKMLKGLHRLSIKYSELNENMNGKDNKALLDRLEIIMID